MDNFRLFLNSFTHESMEKLSWNRPVFDVFEAIRDGERKIPAWPLMVGVRGEIMMFPGSAERVCLNRGSLTK